MKEQELEPGLDVLNTGKGHMEIRYKNNDPIEIERAKRVITDMLRRGYVLFIEGPGKKLTRVKNFNEKKGVYIIADLGDSTPEPVVTPAPGKGDPNVHKCAPTATGATREVPIGKVRATAIARSAGG